VALGLTKVGGRRLVLLDCLPLGQWIALGGQAMQGRLIGNRSGDQGLTGRIAADLEAFEPAGPVTVEDAAHADLVVGGSAGRPHSS
jgi:hypothetical protein